MEHADITVLVIAADPGGTHVLRELLTTPTPPSFTLVCADRLATGLLRVAEGGFDVVLLDLFLTDSQGLATLTAIHGCACTVPIIVLTSVDDEDLAGQAMREGAQDYLIKERMSSQGLARVIRYAIERKRAEEALYAAERYAEHLIGSSLDVIVSVDTEGQITAFNPAAEQTFGYHHTEVIGQPVDILYVEAVAHRFPQQRVIAEGSFRGEVTNRRKDGSTFPAYLSASLIRDASGQIIGIMGILRDISDFKRAETEREVLHQQLVDASRRAGMAEVAIGVLHNVGNVLNSVTTAAALALEEIKESQVLALAKVVALIDAHGDDLATFITKDLQGQHLPLFLRHLAQHLLDERETNLKHLQMVNDKVEHIKEIVTRQQSHATAAGTIEPLSLAKLMDDALKTNDNSLCNYEAEVVRAYAELPLIMIDRHKVFQILLNLVSNAQQALLTADSVPKQLTVRVCPGDADQVYLEVADNGIGIASSDLTRIFQHGFTTKATGHGFGLHSSALTAQELGGSLTVHSDGPGRGAVFRLALPMKKAVP